MARQVIAEDWKMIQYIWDDKTSTINEKESNFGRYTKQTAIEKIQEKYPDYKFKFVRNHGFGGYWVDRETGDTIDLVPAFKN